MPNMADIQAPNKSRKLAAPKPQEDEDEGWNDAVDLI